MLVADFRSEAGKTHAMSESRTYQALRLRGEVE